MSGHAPGLASALIVWRDGEGRSYIGLPPPPGQDKPKALWCLHSAPAHTMAMALTFGEMGEPVAIPVEKCAEEGP